jgi:hypothetical protein
MQVQTGHGPKLLAASVGDPPDSSIHAPLRPKEEPPLPKAAEVCSDSNIIYLHSSSDFSLGGFNFTDYTARFETGSLQSLRPPRRALARGASRACPASSQGSRTTALGMPSRLSKNQTRPLAMFNFLTPLLPTRPLCELLGNYAILHSLFANLNSHFAVVQRPLHICFEALTTYIAFLQSCRGHCTSALRL